MFSAWFIIATTSDLLGPSGDLNSGLLGPSPTVSLLHPSFPKEPVHAREVTEAKG